MSGVHWLVIGGGHFVGRHLVDAALARGDAVTVFNRGQARSEWPHGVQVLRPQRRPRRAAHRPLGRAALIRPAGLAAARG